MPRSSLPPRLLALTTLLLASAAYGCSSAQDLAANAVSNASRTTAPSAPSPPPAPRAAPAPAPDGGEAPPAPPLPEGEVAKTYVDFAINHVLSTGQSNSVANGATPVLTTTQPYTNVSFNTGVMPMSNCDGDGCYQFDAPSSFVPLVEGDNFFGYGVETASAGIANEISHLAAARYHFGTKAGLPSKHDVLVSLHGRSGNTYWCLRKNSCNYHAAGMVKPFSQAMLEVQAAKQIADAAGLSYAVRAVTTIHGESDHYAYTDHRQEFPLDGTDGTPAKIKDYADALVEWQHDYETDAKAITGQALGIPLLVAQLSGWNDARTSRVAQWQLEAHLRAPGKVVLVSPGYAFSVREDCLHYDNHGQRRLGEYFAKAYARIVFSGQAWEPLRPTSVTRSGNAISAKFLVPKPPLVLDTTQVTNPGNYGFDVVDDAGTLLTVASVALAGADTVTITLAAPPAGALHLRYAQNQPVGACIGPGTSYSGGARGNVRDSDDSPSQYGYDLSNWSVAFDVPVK